MRATKQARTGRFARRGFLTAIGVGGLTVAGAVFGAEKANAASCNCCNLVYCPPNTTISSCEGTNHYEWACSVGGSGFLYCYCCEKKNSSGTYYASAYTCRYG